MVHANPVKKPGKKSLSEMRFYIALSQDRMRQREIP
jgi:hypothetical protein